MGETLDRVVTGEADPPCLVCGGILKSDTIAFGQNLVPEVIDRALDVSAGCDVLLAIGSTLSVYPAANCVPTATSKGATVVIVNGCPTAMDDLADEVLPGSRGDRSRHHLGPRSPAEASALEPGVGGAEPFAGVFAGLAPANNQARRSRRAARR